MRNLKKIIAVVVTLVMLFAITSISASAATAPVFSLRGATEVNFLKEVDNEGDPAQYYELAVYLEDAGEQVDAIQGVITYEPEIFTYKDAVLGSALSSDLNSLNSVDNSIKVQYDESKAETGTIKFVGLSDKAGEWFVIRFRITREEKVGATFALKAYAANKESSASLEVNTKSIASTVVDEELINMEGGAILQKTYGLTNDKYILTGQEYNGEKKALNAVFVNPKTAITEYASWEMGMVEGHDITLTGGTADAVSGKLVMPEFKFFTEAHEGDKTLYYGLTSLFFYLEVPADTEVALKLNNNCYLKDGANQYKTANQKVPFYFMAEGADTWVSKKPTQKDEYNPDNLSTAGVDAAYYVKVPVGFKGVVRVDYENLMGKVNDVSIKDIVTCYSMSFFFAYTAGSTAEGATVKLSMPWLAEEYTEEYNPHAIATHVQADKPTQELTFDVKVDAQMLALKEAALNSEVVEVGTLFMYTKRLAYRELTLNMTDKTGLAKASYTITANDRNEGFESLEDFTVYLKNIRWDAMGVSVSARAYIKFKDGTVIYSRNYHNEFETNAGYARESVIGVALDAIVAGHYNTVLAAKYGYDVDNIKSIATTALSTHNLTSDNRILLLNFIADCYKAPEVVAE